MFHFEPSETGRLLDEISGAAMALMFWSDGNVASETAVVSLTIHEASGSGFLEARAGSSRYTP